MKISDILKQVNTSISFEFFPPKTEEAEKQLFQTIKDLEPLNPTFVSVTYGAGGSTRDRTQWVDGGDGCTNRRGTGRSP